MKVHSITVSFRTGGMPLTYRKTFTDHGDEYASLYGGKRLIAADVLLGDAQAICEFFNNGIRRAEHFREMAQRVPAAQPERKDL